MRRAWRNGQEEVAPLPHGATSRRTTPLDKLARRAPKDALLLGGACLAQLAIFAKYEQWQMSSYGPRFLMTVVAVSAWLAAPALEAVVAALGTRASREPPRARAPKRR